MKTVRERTVVITGATSGFGAHLTEAFSSSGFTVIAVGRAKKKLDALTKSIPASRRKRLKVIHADMKTKVGISRIKKALADNDVDVLVNNAAINPELVSKKSLATIEEIQEVFLVNVTATIDICRGAHESFKERGGGTIININSVAGLIGSGHEQVYASSKFALRGFSESVKNDWVKEGVRVVDIFSGAIGTGMSAGRADVSELIDPAELAEYVVDMTRTRTFYAREVNIQRSDLAMQGGGERIIFANGVFDVLHQGHMQLLKFSKGLGDRLIVGLNSDRSTAILKGPERPIHTEDLRKSTLESLDCVDEVIIFDELDTRRVIMELQPHVVVKGEERSAEEIRKLDRIPKNIEVVVAPLIKNSSGAKISTTDTVEKMRKVTMRSEKKNN